MEKEELNDQWITMAKEGRQKRRGRVDSPTPRNQQKHFLNQLLEHDSQPLQQK